MDSLALEVAIGLVLVFLVSALLADAVNEIVSRSLNVRSKALWTRLEELTTSGAVHKLGYPFIATAIWTKVRPRHEQTPNTAYLWEPLTALANTGSIHALDYVAEGRKTKVWKIPGDVFASALLELAHTKASSESLEAQIGDLAKEYAGTPLGGFLASTGTGLAQDADTFIDGTGRWFDSQMEVLSNTYRRNVRLVLGVIGIFVAVFLNVNAITIGQQLAQNASLRQSAVVVASDLTAEEFEECRGKEGEEQYACAAEQIALFTDAGVLIPLQQDYFDEFGKVWTAPEGPSGYGLQVLGIALTAVAVSFGGTFWFDFLRFLTGARKQGGK